MIEDVITGMHLGVRQRVIAAGPVPGAPRSPAAPEGKADTGRPRRAACAEPGRGERPRGMRSGSVLLARLLVLEVTLFS